MHASSRTSHPVSVSQRAFKTCDQQFLESLPANLRLQKGYINAGCCAVLALLANERLYVAACGDCRAVLGSCAKEGQRMVARTMIQDHNCKNARETQLVRERSKDEQVSEKITCCFASKALSEAFPQNRRFDAARMT